MSCLHDFEITLDKRDALVELCKICGCRHVTRKDAQGRIDNIDFIKSHKRDFLQSWYKPHEKEYVEAYGEKRFVERRKIRVPSKPDYEKLREDLIDEIKLAARGRQHFAL